MIDKNFITLDTRIIKFQESMKVTSLHIKDVALPSPSFTPRSTPLLHFLLLFSSRFFPSRRRGKLLPSFASIGGLSLHFTSLPASGRPRQLLSAKHVQVEVVHALTSLHTIVDDHSEALPELLLLRHRLRRFVGCCASRNLRVAFVSCSST